MTDRIHPEALKAFDARANKLLNQLVVLPPREQRRVRFEPNRYKERPITDEDIIGEVRIGHIDSRGRATAAVFPHGGKEVGLVGDAYRELIRLAERMQQQPQLRYVSLEFLHDAIVDWVRDRTIGAAPGAVSMTAVVVPAALAAIAPHRMIVPISDLYVETEISIGGVRIGTVPARMLDQLDERAADTGIPEAARKDLQELAALLRRDLQGLAAVFVELEAETRRAQEIALQYAITATDALRLFSPANWVPGMVCLWAPWGFASRTTRRVLSLGEHDRFVGMVEGLLDVTTFSTLSASDISEIRSEGLDSLSSLLSKPNRTEWEEAVVNASAIFSKGALARDVAVRLVHQFAALESLLLRTDSESIQQNLAERAAFYSLNDPVQRADLVRLFRNVYAKRSAYVHHGRRLLDEDEILSRFGTTAAGLMWQIVRDAQRFPTKAAFLDRIDQVKFS